MDQMEVSSTEAMVAKRVTTLAVLIELIVTDNTALGEGWYGNPTGLNP
jgi:hypothetical protein